MKAIVFTQYGSPDGLEIKEIPKPTPKDDELLISIHASSINSWDWEFLNGSPFVNRLMFGILISLYALNACSDICVPSPLKSFKEFPDSMPYVGAFATHTEKL